MKILELTHKELKKVAVLDDEDYELLKHKKWQLHPCNSGYYARAQFNGKNIMLHRYLLDAPKGMQVDHIDGNTLNCQRANLRLATHAQNRQNAKKAKVRSFKSSKYKGVFWARNNKRPDGTLRETGRWRATVRFDGVERVVCNSHFEVVAARCYDYWAKRQYGEFARLNGI